MTILLPGGDDGGLARRRRHSFASGGWSNADILACCPLFLNMQLIISDP